VQYYIALYAIVNSLLAYLSINLATHTSTDKFNCFSSVHFLLIRDKKSLILA